MDRQAGLREILDTIMAWCAEADLLTNRTQPDPERLHTAETLVSRLEKIEAHRDWNGVLGWALREVALAQIPHISTRGAQLTRGRHQVYRNEHLTSALLNVIALCTIWIREIEGRPEKPASDVLGKLREKTAETVEVWKNVPYEKQK